MKSALQSFSEKLLQASRDYSASLASMSVAKNQLPKIQDALHQAYREAAAVVDSFNPLTIVPSTGSEKPAAGLYTPLLSDSERRIGSPNQWTLRRDVRMATLNQLVSEGRLPAALATMSQVSPGDPLLIVLSEIISKAGFSLTNRSLEILATALKLRQWLDEIGIELALPDEIVIRQELEFLRLLSPFHHLSDEHFTGRKADLDVLRKYVGVADSSLRGNFFRLVIGILDLYKNKPLMIYGIGGMGKSTLIARFILEHTEQPMKRRFPFAYIDFDQPEVVAEEPITILAAIVRQVGMQSELIRSECEKLRREINEFTGLAIGDNTRESLVQLEAIDFVRSSSSSGSERQIFVQKFVRLFQQANTKNQPLLLILDTFEELQFHEPEHIPDLFHFLNILQQALPRLRVIIAGRRLEAEWCRGHELAPLTEDDAQEYLRGHGVPKDLSIC